jgi:hypothetical protein
VLSLSTSHSFELDEVALPEQPQRRADPHPGPARRAAVRRALALERGVAMALPRFVGGRKVAPQIQRMKSEDLVAAVFPDQIACLENIVGERQIPDHPLVEQTLDDCLHEAMDSEGWLALLRRMESGEVRLLCRDLPALRPWPQPFSTRGRMPFSTMPAGRTPHPGGAQPALERCAQWRRPGRAGRGCHCCRSGRGLATAGQ